MYKVLIAGLLIASATVWAVDFEITVLNTFECSYAQQILGMDYYEAEDILYFVSNVDDKVYSCNPDDGTFVNKLDCIANNRHPFGCAIEPSSGSKTYVNNCLDLEKIYVYNGSWVSYPNPASTYGRGMDYAPGSPDYVWESYAQSFCYRISADLSSFDRIDLDGMPVVQISGLTWFNYEGGGEGGLLCTNYDGDNLYFYSISGTTSTLECTIPAPVTADEGYFGLAYSDSRDTVFLSYENNSTYYITELSINEIVSIESLSLGEIKASFK